MAELGLAVDPISTQIVQRDRHAAWLAAIAVTGGSLERFATEVRNLQHTEIGELQEPFRARPEGLERDAPQAQPDHCRSALSGPGAAAAWLRAGRASRTRRCGTSATSRTRRSSAWRCPARRRCCTTCSSASARIVDGLVVRPERMRENVERGLGLYASSRLLTALVEEGGLSRERAYAIVQRDALRAADERRQLREVVAGGSRRDAACSDADHDRRLLRRGARCCAT